MATYGSCKVNGRMRPTQQAPAIQIAADREVVWTVTETSGQHKLSPQNDAFPRATCNSGPFCGASRRAARTSQYAQGLSPLNRALKGAALPQRF